MGPDGSPSPDLGQLQLQPLRCSRRSREASGLNTEATPSEKPCGYWEAIQSPSRFSAAWTRADTREMRS